MSSWKTVPNTVPILTLTQWHLVNQRRPQDPIVCMSCPTVGGYYQMVKTKCPDCKIDFAQCHACYNRSLPWTGSEERAILERALSPWRYQRCLACYRSALRPYGVDA